MIRKVDFYYTFKSKPSCERSEAEFAAANHLYKWRQTICQFLKNLICMKSIRLIRGKTSVEAKYYIANEKANAQKHGIEIRSHWDIENKVPW
ncbi:hypothetical protein NEOC84_000836|nr:hypothetical protein [Neochlamydia sp. AcF84]